jgi:hypothetical protein
VSSPKFGTGDRAEDALTTKLFRLDVRRVRDTRDLKRA